MKKNQFWGLALAATVVLSSTSCSKDEFLDVNQNPNSPAAVGMPLLLTSTLLTTGFANTNDLGRVTSLLVQHIAGIANQSATYDVYNIRGSFDNQWNGELYSGSLVNTKLLIDQAVQKNSPAYGGIAKLIQAYNYALTTDLYGDIPYSQALQGVAILTPRFDKQEDIYKGNTAKGIKSLFELVKDGLADLDKPSTLKPSIADDPVYGGDLTKWKQMGNTLLLKLANTISKKEPALAGPIIAQAAAGAITTNANDFQIPFGTSTTNLNPLYQFNFVTRPDDQMLSQRLLDSMSVRRDPRLPIYFNTTPTNTAATTTPLGIFTGYQNGSPNAVPVRANRSRYNVYIRGASGEAPARLLTNFQRLFILAESAVQGLPGFTLPAGTTAQSLYQSAIRASMTKAGVADADVTAYFVANPRVALLSTNATVAQNQIITQKWIAWVGNGYEAYNDYRRTGFPSLPVVQNAAGDDPSIIPRRIPYPNSELNANTNAEGLDKNIRTSAPVWWAQ
ncbi:SusD/RagB family nutrient-binding outer membrane lipoprotein [Hymenobacter siberiensis]|uniref:SusD/RagB family nutrient-binding outer membrane lipoprotein n=1 Tax=Hymenobacter siberiensis TaxID=2848396 RepID=UPI001C1E71E8|nr:SusD/RagB family nutrient-binding outer membrane lipoprotein [Hymenobacter siberiensis]MBU6120918.1 SusD/RagB family nutrient-binding outer membrane lipoprotein [Hymenobacter siberiensis]